MRMNAVPGGPAKHRHATVVIRDDLLALLNEDFARECRSVYGYAVFAEHLRVDGRPKRAAAVERRGKAEVTHALVLCQLIYDFGGSITASVDEMNAVLNADRVATAKWGEETVQRLRERARQLRAVGEPGLGKRLHRLAEIKCQGPDLASIVRGPKRAFKKQSP